MTAYTTVTYDLGPHDVPLVVVLDKGRVSLHYQGWNTMPLGFSIVFMQEHLSVVRELCRKLEDYDRGTSIGASTDDETHDVTPAS